MKAYEINKLVRDNTIEAINANVNNLALYEIIDSDEEYHRRLLDKIIEELDEYKQYYAYTELIDLLEVIYSIGKLKGFSENDMNESRKSKEQLRGIFDKRILLKTIVTNDK